MLHATIPTEARTFRIHKKTLFNSGRFLVVQGVELKEDLPCDIQLTFKAKGGSSVEIRRFENAKGQLVMAVSGSLDDDWHPRYTRSILSTEELTLEVRDMDQAKKC